MCIDLEATSTHTLSSCGDIMVGALSPPELPLSRQGHRVGFAFALQKEFI